MSWETQSWAARQRPGKSSGKLVLLGLASCADANHCAYPSLQWLCDFSDLDRKTVIAALDRLMEIGLIEDTQERRGRTKQVKVYRLTVLPENGASALVSDPSSETMPEPEPFKSKSTVFSGKEFRKRNTEPFREPIPPTETIVSVCPQGPKHTNSKSKGKGGSVQTSRLPDDWTAPDVASLPDAQRLQVSQWPPFAYQLVAEGFRLHFLAEAGVRSVKRDWAAAFGKWLLTAHPRVMRDAKAGVKFGEMPAALPSGLGSAPSFHRAVAGEDARSLELRITLAGVIPERTFSHWMAPLAWLVRDDGRLEVIGSSGFALDWVRDNHGKTINAVAQKVIGSIFSGTVYTVERVKDGSRSQGEEHGQEQRDDHRRTGGSRSAAGASGDHTRRSAEVRA